jgi:hypothetical protein
VCLLPAILPEQLGFGDPHQHAVSPALKVVWEKVLIGETDFLLLKKKKKKIARGRHLMSVRSVNGDLRIERGCIDTK